MERLVSGGFGLIEAPLWTDKFGLLFSDVIKGGVYSWNNDTVSVVLEHRRGIGGMALHEDGGLLISGRNIAYRDTTASCSAVVLGGDDVGIQNVGFNDIAVDPTGCLLVGTLGSKPTTLGVTDRPGALVGIDTVGRLFKPAIAGGLAMPNGIAFSPDGRRLYVADTGRRTIMKFHYGGDGRLSAGREFARMNDGRPDGIAIAQDGSVWVAEAFAGQVVGFDADGGTLQRIAVPEPLVTNVCFGGPGLSDLFITTGSMDEEKSVGCVYRIPAPVPGLQLSSARVPYRCLLSREH